MIGGCTFSIGPDGRFMEYNFPSGWNGKNARTIITTTCESCIGRVCVFWIERRCLNLSDGGPWDSEYQEFPKDGLSCKAERPISRVHGSGNSRVRASEWIDAKFTRPIRDDVQTGSIGETGVSFHGGPRRF